MGADFSDVLLGGFGFFGKVEREPGLNAAGDRHHLFSDPGKGEVGDEVIRFKIGIDPHQIPSHGQHIVVGEENSLGKEVVPEV